MNCPIDQTPLTMSERSGIEIDYCPACRGVWLDRGELDKLIERSDVSRSDHAPSRPQQDDSREYSKPHNVHKKHKKESFLGDLFDF